MEEKEKLKRYFDRLYASSRKDFEKLIDERLKKEEKSFIITANPETFTYGLKDEDVNDMLLDQSTIVIPDGIGIVKIANDILNHSIKERITGIDLADHFLKIANEYNYKVALLGAKEEVIEALKAKITTDYPKIDLVKCENGYIEDKDAFFEEIRDLAPDIVMIGLGIPLQEKLIYRHLEKFDKGIFIGVGGSFDVLSGTKKRAPKIFQKLNLEWLYRILREPKRIKRFYNNNIKFLLKVKRLKSEDK